MGTTYRFIDRPGLPSQVIDWFRTRNHALEEVQNAHRHTFYFPEFGELMRDGEGDIDSEASPIVTVFLPRVTHGVLWTVGEVHFLATPLRERFPMLHKTSSSFAKWLKSFDCVFSSKPGGEKDWNYYLEGSTRNFDPPIYALPAGFSELQAGRYFVSDDESPLVLEKLRSTLRLRGVDTDAGA
jgi:hypothetical protein